MYKRVHHITAGAGAGKTTELVKIITRLVKDEGADPARMILTTFTVAAATEFRERSKAALPVEKAIEMNAALMGTLHSLAEKYIRRYWYLLGISPAVKPISESVSGILMDRSLEGLVNGDENVMLKRYAETFGITLSTGGYDYDFWKDTLQKLLSMMRRYGYGKEKVGQFRDRTLALLENIFTQEGNSDILSGVKASMLPYLDYQKVVEEGATDAGKETYQKNCAQIKKILTLDPMAVTVRELKEFEGMKWGKPVAFNKKYAEKDRYTDEISACKDAVVTAQATLCESMIPKECSMIMDVAELIFDILPLWLDRYSEVKRRSGVIDFADMERLFLDLLHKQQVIDDIEKSVDYLFVDEFQDSNPVQAEIYDILSNHIKQSWFVGDRKQAIYGFTGSDAGLISELTRNFPAPCEDKSSFTGFHKDDNGNSSQILGHSYRSAPKLVNAANAVFVKSFEDTTGGRPGDAIPEAEVRLEWGGLVKDTAWDPIYHVSLDGGNNAVRADALATFICNMTQSEGFIKAGYGVSDIAILTRSTSQSITIGNALARKGIPTAFVDPKGFRDTPEVAVLLAILKLSEGIDTAKSRAEIRKLVLDEDLTRLAEKVKDGKNSLEDIPGLEAFARSIRHHSVLDRINEIIARTDLLGLCGRWSNPDSRRGGINLVRNAAVEYADKSEMLCIEADVRGFLSFLNNYSPEVKFDNMADGVKVLTYHKAKGLEWKIVFLCGLDEYKEDKSISGITIVGPSATPDGLIAVPRLPDKDWVAGCISRSKDASAILEQIRAIKIGEEKRLLYVGFTRAKEVVVTVAKDTSPEVITRLCPTARMRVNALPSGDMADIWGIHGLVSRYTFVSDDPNVEYTDVPDAVKYKDAGLFLPAKEVEDESPVKYNSPSEWHDTAIEATAIVTQLKDFGGRTDIPHPGLEDNVFGDCIHHIYAACEPASREENLSVAGKTLKSFGIEDPSSPVKVIDCLDALYGWLAEEYGPMIAIEKELPVRYTDKEGRVFSGNMDLVWVTEKGCVLVDYKTFPGKRSDLFDKANHHWAGGYASQLKVYSDALEAGGMGRPIACLLYYPVEGLIIGVDS